jgi:hypothetical protein
MPRLLNRVTGQGQLIFGVAIAALGGEHLVCARMAVQPFPARFHAVVIPVIPWVPAYPWLAYVTGAALIVTGVSIPTNARARGGALLFGALFLGSDLILHIPRMMVVPQNWVCEGKCARCWRFRPQRSCLRERCRARTAPFDDRIGRWQMPAECS